MRSLAAVRRRLRRRSTVITLVVVGVVGAGVIYAGSARPDVDVFAPVAVTDAYAGTTYGFDGLVCLGAGAGTAELEEVVRTTTPQGLVVELGPKPQGTAPAIGFPVAQGPAPGELQVPAGGFECLRLTARPERTGSFAAPEVSVPVRYGPGGLLRRTVDVRLPIRLEVTSTGTDPRVQAAAVD